MKKSLPLDAVEGVTADTWRRLGALLMQRRGEGVMPHELSNHLRLHRKPVLAIIYELGRRDLVDRKYCVYHRCSEAPVHYRRFEDGFQPTPWTCPECDEEIMRPDELRYDLICLVPGRLELEA